MNIKTAILISLAVHAALAAVVIGLRSYHDEPFGNGVVTVDIIGEGTGEPLATAAPEPFQQTPKSSAAKEVPAATVMTLGKKRSSTGNETTGTSETANASSSVSGAAGSGGGLGSGSLKGDPVLSKIRQRIERAKYYPQEAKRQKMEGRPEVTFQINPDGTLASTTLKSSSGNELLDAAALETVKRAAPLPYFERPISLAIKFSLED